MGLLLFCLISLSGSTENGEIRPAQWGFQVISVVQRGFAAVEGFFSSTINSISELSRLKEAYDEMQTQLEVYRGWAKDLKVLELENHRLRRELDFSRSIGMIHIPAEVIAKDPVNHFSAIIINKGSNQGVEQDMPVVAFNRGLQGLVGRIVEVGPFSSKVKPLYDESSYVAARMLSSRYEGLIQGGGGEVPTLMMNYVKKGARREIQFGDLVVTSGMNSLYPREIYIGTLKEINGKEWETSLQLELEPVIDFSRLEYVYILKGEQQ